MDDFRDDDPVRSIADIEQTLADDEGSFEARGEEAPADTSRDRRVGTLLVARWLLMKASTALLSIDSSGPLFSAAAFAAVVAFAAAALDGDNDAIDVRAAAPPSLLSLIVTCGVVGLRNRGFFALFAALSNGVAGDRRVVGLFLDEDMPPSERFGLNVCG